MGGGDGDDTINLSADEIVTGTGGGAGNDVINIEAGTALGIDGGTGDDSMSLKVGSAFDIKGGDGNDTITINTQGTVFGVSGGKGDDHIIIGSAQLATYFSSEGDGNDLVEPNNALEIKRFSVDGTLPASASGMRVQFDDDTLAISFPGSNDSITAKLTGRMASADQIHLVYKPDTNSLLIADDQYFAGGMPGQPIATFKRP